MTELANWVTERRCRATTTRVERLRLQPVRPAPRSARGKTFDGRPVLDTGGSSSGAGTAASFWAANVGTETSGSILSPSNQQHAGRHQADGRAREPLRCHPDHRRPGHAGADGAHGDRCRDHARRARGPRRRSARSGDDAAARRRPAATTRSSCARDGLKGRGSASRAPTTTPRRRRPAAEQPRGGSQRGAGEGHGRRHRGAEAAGGDHRRSRRTSRASSTRDPERNYARLGRSARACDEVKERDCSIVLGYGMKRDFNRWLDDARRPAPVKSLTGLRQWNRGACDGGRDQYGQSMLDISDAMDLDDRPGALRGGPRAGPRADGDARHRRSDEGEQARRDPFSRAVGRVDRGAARLPDGDRAVRHGAERARRRRSRTDSTRSRRRSA